MYTITYRIGIKQKQEFKNVVAFMNTFIYYEKPISLKILYCPVNG